MRRSGPASGSYLCTVFLDADASFTTQWSGPCLPTDSGAACTQRQAERVTAKMVSILHEADLIYAVSENVYFHLFIYQALFYFCYSFRGTLVLVAPGDSD
jgi:hypothetical protein